MAKRKNRKASAKRVVIKKGKKMVNVSSAKVRSMLKTAGYSGKTLVIATKQVVGETKKIAKAGVITATGFERAIVRGVSKANDHVVSATKKVARRVLK